MKKGRKRNALPCFFSDNVRGGLQWSSPYGRVAADTGVFLRYSDQINHRSIDQNFAGMFKVNGNSVPDDGLHLTDTPIRSSGMTDAHAWHDKMHFRGFP